MTGQMISKILSTDALIEGNAIISTITEGLIRYKNVVVYLNHSVPISPDIYLFIKLTSAITLSDNSSRHGAINYLIQFK